MNIRYPLYEGVYRILTFKTDKNQTERTGWANETEDAGYRRTNGKRPFPGQLPAGRIRKRGITPVAESEKAVLGTDRCGRELRDAALRKEPSLQLRQIHAGRIPGEGGKRTRLCAGQ